MDVRIHSRYSKGFEDIAGKMDLLSSADRRLAASECGMRGMPTPMDTPRADEDPQTFTGTRSMTRSMAWAELSLLEARQMSAEATRIVARSKSVCRRGIDPVAKALPSA